MITEGMRALTIAALTGHEPMVELLLSHNAQPDGLAGESESLRTRDEAASLELLAQDSHDNAIEMERRLERRSKLGGGAVGGGTAAAPAKQPAAPHTKTEVDVWPLYVACRHGHTGIVRRLLETNANVHVERRDGCSALHVAASNGYEECVALLLEANATVANWNYLGVGPLCACWSSGSRPPGLAIEHLACYAIRWGVAGVLLLHRAPLLLPLHLPLPMPLPLPPPLLPPLH